jgi:hypothetical protein
MRREIKGMVDKIQAQVLLKRKAQALKANLKRRKEAQQVDADEMSEIAPKAAETSRKE